VGIDEDRRVVVPAAVLVAHGNRKDGQDREGEQQGRSHADIIQHRT
jgi:hypothetical protein